MSFFEYGDEIVIIDAGIQFPEEETPGIDYIIPNVSYLEPKKKNVKALIVTHAHFDHIGAIPYIIGKIGNPPIYTTPLAREMILKRQAEFVNAPKLDIRTIKDGDVMRLSENFEAEFFGVSHSVPDTTGVILKTPVGNMATFADFKIETDIEGKPVSLEGLEKIAKKDIHTIFLDSTNAESVGWSPSERLIEKNLEDLFKKVEGRIIVGIFSTLISRIGEIIKIAEKLDRKVVFSGRSIKENTEIARNLGYVKVKSGTIISPEEVSKYDDRKILILSTGAQGESNASLMKIVTGEHKHLRIKPGDSIVFSSSVIPGNERSVQGLKDNLVRQGAMIYHYKMLDIHTTGHASQGEIKTIPRSSSRSSSSRYTDISS
jgi:ribonuclease J